LLLTPMVGGDTKSAFSTVHTTVNARSPLWVTSRRWGTS